MRPVLSASLMCADWLRLAPTLQALETVCGALHVDIMDGHFCKSLYLSPWAMETVRRATKLPMEAHLMVERPEDWIDAAAEAGAACILLHAETVERQAFRLIERIHAHGCRAGVALCPATPLSAAEAYLGRLEQVTVMTVDPGFAGQPFLPEGLEKLRALRAWREKHGARFLLQADGGVNRTTYRALFDAGAENFVLGSGGLFGLDADVGRACKRMCAQLDAALSEVET